jgi:Family of unknown function (DUF6000)
MPKDPLEFEAILTEYVAPFYLSLLHGNIMRKDAKHALGLPALLSTAAKQITDAQLNCLLNEREWRGRLTAGWFIALTKRSSFVEKITGLLLASGQAFAGEGYCLALGLIGGRRCEEGLRAYLAKYLPLRGRIFDQQWAIGALAHIQGMPPQEFLEPSLWKLERGELNPALGIEFFAELVNYLVMQGLVTDQSQ